MRKFIYSFLVMIFTAATLLAQPQRHHSQTQDGNFAEFQTQIIIKQLQLEESQRAPFEALYKEYSEKDKALHPRPQYRNKMEGGKESKLTDVESEKIILESFEMSERLTELRREYYYKFKEILSPRQILKMYSTERRIRERIVMESDRRNDGVTNKK